MQNIDKIELKAAVDLTLKSFLAGILISLGGVAFLQSENKVIGSLLFSIGLIAVVLLGANLFTGKIGYVDSIKLAKNAVIILISNLLAAFLVGLLYKSVTQEFSLITVKLTKSVGRVLFDSILCGVCIYIAVEGYKKSKSLIPVILGVMVFILAGGEHCIANMFYLGAGNVTWKGLGYIGLNIIGNSIGSLLVRYLQVGVEHEIHANL